MSQSNVELVRSACEAFACGAWDDAAARLDPDVEWDMSAYEVPGADSEQPMGRTGAVGFLRSFLGAWEGYEAEFSNFLGVGDRVIVEIVERGRGRGSGVPVERAWAQVWTVRDGRLVRFQSFRDRDEACAAAAGEQLTEAWNDWDVERMLALMHPEVEIHGLRSAVEDTSYRGHEGARTFFADSEESWESLHTELLEMRVFGNRVATRHRLRLRGRGSGAAIEQEVGILFELEDGLIRLFRTYLVPTEAFEAAAASQGYPAER